jgi:hypothetical protein
MKPLKGKDLGVRAQGKEVPSSNEYSAKEAQGFQWGPKGPGKHRQCVGKGQGQRAPRGWEMANRRPEG